MDKKDIELSQAVINSLEKNKKLSRRDALKVMGIGGASTLINFSPLEAKEEELNPKTNKKVTIVVAGAGMGGIMSVARVRRQLPNAKIILIAPNEKHIYQPGQVFEAAGLYEFEDIVKDNKKFIHKDVEWIKEEVAIFDPDNNRVVTTGKKEITYDGLIVATGVVYHYDWIKGLTEDDIGKYGISSVYLSDLAKGTAKGGSITWKWFNDVKEFAKKKKPTVIYTEPNTPLKCGGTPQKILYLSADYLKKDDNLSGNFIFATKRSKLFSIKEINDSLEKVQAGYDKITNKFRHNLIEIDKEKRVATFEATVETKGEYDPDLEEYDITIEKKIVKMNYDFIHIVPPTTPSDAIVNSPLGWQKGNAKGWLAVDRETLQHIKYKNVFGIGDVCGIPKGKTGGSARHHAPVVVGNLVDYIEGKKLEEKFDGYTVCPLKVRYGAIIMAEFNYEGLAPSFPLDPAKPRYSWWTFDLYMLKPMYWNLMLRGWM